ncbi:uncharacterized protein BDR25DRAFT_348298 [Lindgomyces ingoldianus]|uniref:Uncharacterized protein n=1 Tax=Lindgomyces ingoldianus TaxID=673940 RepID=A0ACB6RHK9_9PLEO|nr:uncharacterized protein BDR25DRAFT_348298 [Lindgomyces ingoldianus]KAF2478002.1 hypothetical protein BDR25DRAFT_348298 [Lindgomyces ingoldianus]
MLANGFWVVNPLFNLGFSHWFLQMKILSVLVTNNVFNRVIALRAYGRDSDIICGI